MNLSDNFNKTEKLDFHLHTTIDAAVWADAWLETISKNPTIPYDRGSMIGWFANAMRTKK